MNSDDDENECSECYGEGRVAESLSGIELPCEFCGQTGKNIEAHLETASNHADFVQDRFIIVLRGLNARIKRLETANVAKPAKRKTKAQRVDISLRAIGNAIWPVDGGDGASVREMVAEIERVMALAHAQQAEILRLREALGKDALLLVDERKAALELRDAAEERLRDARRC